MEEGLVGSVDLKSKIAGSLNIHRKTLSWIPEVRHAYTLRFSRSK